MMVNIETVKGSILLLLNQILCVLFLLAGLEVRLLPTIGRRLTFRARFAIEISVYMHIVVHRGMNIYCLGSNGQRISIVPIFLQ